MAQHLKLCPPLDDGFYVYGSATGVGLAALPVVVATGGFGDHPMAAYVAAGAGTAVAAVVGLRALRGRLFK
jgi:hypothetical protein